jgi:adenosylcobinamide-GDP ribazoletransferase
MDETSSAPAKRKTFRLTQPLTDFLVALQFLTIAPPFLRRMFEPAELGRSVGYYPLVGLAVGALLWGADELLLHILPPLVVAALVLGLWVLLTGALHTDGFIDTCDGLLGGTTPETRLAIMKDEHVGAYAIIGGALLLIAKFAAVSSLAAGNALALVLVPALGRWAIAIAMIAFPYARAAGLGRDIKDHAGWPQALLATIIALAAAWLLGGWRGIAAAALAAGVAGLGAAFTLRRLPGLTGDIYGAINELAEVAALLVFLVR